MSKPRQLAVAFKNKVLILSVKDNSDGSLTLHGVDAIVANKGDLSDLLSKLDFERSLKCFNVSFQGLVAPDVVEVDYPEVL